MMEPLIDCWGGPFDGLRMPDTGVVLRVQFPVNGTWHVAVYALLDSVPPVYQFSHERLVVPEDDDEDGEDDDSEADPPIS